MKRTENAASSTIHYLAKETVVLVDVCENVETDRKKGRERGRKVGRGVAFRFKQPPCPHNVAFFSHTCPLLISEPKKKMGKW